MNELYALLSDCCPNIDFSSEKTLMTDHILDSIDLVSIIMSIQAKYNLSFDPSDITHSNFDSIDAIHKLINRKLSE